MESTDNIQSTVYELKVENELRFVIGEEKTASIELLSGFAEIFGSELVQNTVYTFPPYTSVSLFSWQGCSVKLSGKDVKARVSSDSLIMIPVSIHACLEERRMLAEYISGKGPVSLVVGSMQSGKSSFCRFLLNYAARMGRKPLYIDLDVARNRSSVPGTVSIFSVEQPSDVADGFFKQACSVYAFGYNHPRENAKLYCLLIKQIGETVRNRLCQVKPDKLHSGIIIDTVSWTRKKGHVVLALAAKVFKIDVVFVVSNNKLYKRLRKDMPSSVEIVSVPKQKGVVENKKEHKILIEDNVIRQYFYGSIQNPLIPYEFCIRFSDIQIYSAFKHSNTKVKNADLHKVCIEDIKVIAIPIKPKLVNSILGLSFADKFDANIFVTNVRCFICVIGIDMEKEVFTVLSPHPAPLPGKIFILNFVKFNNECKIKI